MPSIATKEELYLKHKDLTNKVVLHAYKNCRNKLTKILKKQRIITMQSS